MRSQTARRAASDIALIALPCTPRSRARQESRRRTHESVVLMGNGRSATGRGVLKCFLVAGGVTPLKQGVRCNRNFHAQIAAEPPVTAPRHITCQPPARHALSQHVVAWANQRRLNLIPASRDRLRLAPCTPALLASHDNAGYWPSRCRSCCCRSGSRSCTPSCTRWAQRRPACRSTSTRLPRRSRTRCAIWCPVMKADRASASCSTSCASPRRVSTCLLRPCHTPSSSRWLPCRCCGKSARSGACTERAPLLPSPEP